MAIARDANSNGTHTSTSLTVAHTVSGSNRLLLAFVIDQAGDTVTGVTYNSVAMTQIRKRVRGSTEYIYVYGLLAPDTGTNNIVASRSNDAFDIAIGASSYTGVKQTGLPDAQTDDYEAGSTTITTPITTVADNCWTFFGVSDGGSSALAAGTGSTVITVISTDVGKIFDNQDNGAITPAGSYTMIVSSGSATDKGGILVSFAPAVAAGPANLKTYNTNVAANIKTINTNAIANVKSLNTNT